MLVGLSALLLLQAPTVTWSAQCTTVGVALEEIAKQTDTKLSAAPECREQTLVIRVAAADKDLLLAKVAAVIGARWSRDPSGELRLSRPQGLEIEQRAQSRNRRLKELEASIKEMSEEGSKPYDVAKAVAKMAALGRGTEAEESLRSEFGSGADQPTSRMIYRLMRYIPAEKIAELEGDDQIVYSTHPTRMQLPFGQKALSEISWLNTAHDQLIAALAKNPKVAHRFSWTDTHEWTSPVAKLTLSISAPTGFGPNLELKGYSSKGDQVMQSLGSLRPKNSPMSKEPTILSAKVALNDYERGLQKALLDRFSTDQRGTPQQLPALVKEGILDVEHRDATQAIPSRIFMQAADQNKVQLVASLPSSFFWITQSFDESKPLTAFWQAASNLADVRLEKGWLSVRPLDFYESRQSAFTRAAMSRYFGMLARENRESVMAASLLYATVPAPTSFSPVRQVGRLLATGGAVRDPFNGGSLRPFQFVGFAGEATMNTLENGGLQLGVLPKPARDTLSRYVFGSSGFIQKDLGNRAFRSEEATEVLPSGLPAGATITLSRRQSVCGFDASTSNPFAFEMPFDARNVAFQLVKKEQGTAGKNERVIESFRIGSKTTWMFIISYGEGLTTTFVLEETAVDRSTGPTPLEQFPEKFKADVLRYMEQERKSTRPKTPPP